MKINTLIKLIIFLIFSASLYIPLFADDITSNAYLDKNSNKFRVLQTVLARDWPSFSSTGERNNIFPDNKEICSHLYLLAMNHYKNNEYESAIDNFIGASNNSEFPPGIIYYQLGLCLMDSGDLETAKLAFEKAIYFGIRPMDNMENTVTIDNNGIIREKYFSYYNISCIESLRNNITESFEWLCMALYCGYPYISHIRTDSDLYNLFNKDNSSYYKQLENIYNAGTRNTMFGKGFQLYGGSYREEYHFIDSNRVYITYVNMYSPFGISDWVSAEYEIRNYIVFFKNINRIRKNVENYNTPVYQYIKDFENNLFSKNYANLNFSEIPLKSYNDINRE
jgi:tetratricopeptide (TPR) repeat protein